MRMVRATMLEVLLTRPHGARQGARRRVLVRHALRNALIPVVTVVGFEIGS